jgi:hypothetical protein
VDDNVFYSSCLSLAVFSGSLSRPYAVDSSGDKWLRLSFILVSCVR